MTASHSDDTRFSWKSRGPARLNIRGRCCLSRRHSRQDEVKGRRICTGPTRIRIVEIDRYICREYG